MAYSDMLKKHAAVQLTEIVRLATEAAEALKTNDTYAAGISQDLLAAARTFDRKAFDWSVAVKEEQA